jgi:hypothetical protein
VCGGSRAVPADSDREDPVWKTHQVGAAYADIDVSRNIQAAHFTAEVFATVQEFSGNHLVGKDAPFMVDVPKKKVQCREPLR